ncbi:MAG: iron-sulfur cluster assembly protein, partial [Alphaproteobacteria bacterium]|nr:iron-sulfur cluster assembly protein [Alphaproteobacteria bacterium]
MAAVTEEQVRTALKSVIDPDRGADVVAAGMISGVHVRDGHITFSIEVRPEEGATKEPIRKACEKAVEALPGTLSVSAVLTASRPSGAAKAAAAGPAAHSHAPGSGHTHAPGHGHAHG